MDESIFGQEGLAHVALKLSALHFGPVDHFKIYIFQFYVKNLKDWCIQGVSYRNRQSNLPLRDGYRQVEISLKVVLLKSWDGCIYENVSQISLTQTVAKIWLFLSKIYGQKCQNTQNALDKRALRTGKKQSYPCNCFSERDLSCIFRSAIPSPF